MLKNIDTIDELKTGKFRSDWSVIEFYEAEIEYYSKAANLELVKECKGYLDDEIKKFSALSIIKKYPDIFGTPPFDPMKNLMCFGFTCDVDYYPLIYDLLKDIQKILDEDKTIVFKILQVKEKFGELRIYKKSNNSTIDALINEVQNKSKGFYDDNF